MKKLLLMLLVCLFSVPSMADCFKYKEGVNFMTGQLNPVQDSAAARAKFKKYTPEQLKRPLLAAVNYDDLECTREFLKRGANPNMWMESMGYRNYYIGAYPLKSAINSDSPVSLEILRVLLEYKADMTLRDKNVAEYTYNSHFESALHKAIFRAAQSIYARERFDGSDLRIKKLKLLLEYGKKNNFLEKADEDLISLTLESAMYKTLAFVKLLLRYDIKVTRNDIHLAKKLQKLYEPKGTDSRLHYFRDQVKLLEDARKIQIRRDVEKVKEMLESKLSQIKNKITK